MKLKLTYLLLLLAFVASAQKRDRHLPRGNNAYEDKEFAAAEAEYRISRAKFQKSESAYNLGNSIYRQGQAAESKNSYLQAIKDARTHEQKHRAYHNLGNVYMQTKEYQAAVEAYKSALRANPDDDETRYNYALARKLLEKNPPPEGKDDKDKKKDQKDQDKDKKDQDNKNQDQQQKEKDQQQNQDQQNKQNQQNRNDRKEDGQDQDKKQPQPQGGIPKDRLENMLDAVNNEEKKIQEKINAKKVKVKPIETEKDW